MKLFINTNTGTKTLVCRTNQEIFENLPQVIGFLNQRCLFAPTSNTNIYFDQDIDFLLFVDTLMQHYQYNTKVILYLRSNFLIDVLNKYFVILTIVKNLHMKYNFHLIMNEQYLALVSNLPKNTSKQILNQLLDNYM